MARIRSLKPEAFQSETLSEVSLEAERTFFGLSTLADDRGRVADKPAVINGALWAVRSERKLHTAADVDTELTELELAGAVCRYVGCDGKRYLHLITWDEHQKIDKASLSRQPRCPRHISAKDRCGKHGDEPCPAPPVIAAKASVVSVTESIPSEQFPESSRESRESSPKPPEEVAKPAEPSGTDLGPRTLDLGAFPPLAGTATPRRDPSKPINAGDVIAAYMDGAKSTGQPRPTEKLRNKVGRDTKRALAEPGASPEAIFAAAFNMGAAGWSDIDTQIQRDVADAKKRASQGPETRFAPQSGARAHVPTAEELEDMEIDI